MRTLKTKLQTVKTSLMAVLLSGMLFSCGDDNDPQNNIDLDNLPATKTVNENAAQLSFVFQASASVTNSPKAVITYEIVSGNESDAFQIDPVTGSITVNNNSVLDYETTRTFELGISASGESQAITETLTIKLADLEDERYLERVFGESTFRNPTIISYGNTQYQTLEMYQPLGDSETSRPVVLLAGGGTYGAPSHKPAMLGMAFDMTQRGFVTAYVNFTQFNGNCGLNCEIDPTFETSIEMGLTQVQDLRGAIRFIRKNADQYKINPDEIYLAGWATGGGVMTFSALFNDGYVFNTSDEVLNELMNDIIGSDPHGVDGALNPGYSSKVSGVVSMMTSTFDLDMIDATDPNILFINHELATTDTGCDFSKGERRTDNYFARLTTESGHEVFTYGTNSMFNKAKAVGLCSSDIRYVENEGPLTEDLDYEYLLMTGTNGNSGFCPNVSIMTSNNYDFIANFFYRNLQD